MCNIVVSRIIIFSLLIYLFVLNSTNAQESSLFSESRAQKFIEVENRIQNICESEILSFLSFRRQKRKDLDLLFDSKEIKDIDYLRKMYLTILEESHNERILSYNNLGIFFTSEDINYYKIVAKTVYNEELRFIRRPSRVFDLPENKMLENAEIKKILLAINDKYSNQLEFFFQEIYLEESYHFDCFKKQKLKEDGLDFEDTKSFIMIRSDSNRTPKLNLYIILYLLCIETT